MSQKWVYLFSEGNKDMRDLLGGKGAGVAEMTRIGLPVPPGFTITTEACLDYFSKGQKLPKGLWEQVLAAGARPAANTPDRIGLRRKSDSRYNFHARPPAATDTAPPASTGRRLPGRSRWQLGFPFEVVLSITRRVGKARNSKCQIRNPTWCPFSIVVKLDILV